MPVTSSNLRIRFMTVLRWQYSADAVSETEPLSTNTSDRLDDQLIVVNVVEWAENVTAQILDHVRQLSYRQLSPGTTQGGGLEAKIDKHPDRRGGPVHLREQDRSRCHGSFEAGQQISHHRLVVGPAAVCGHQDESHTVVDVVQRHQMFVQQAPCDGASASSPGTPITQYLAASSRPRIWGANGGRCRSPENSSDKLCCCSRVLVLAIDSRWSRYPRCTLIAKSSTACQSTSTCNASTVMSSSPASLEQGRPRDEEVSAHRRGEVLQRDALRCPQGPDRGGKLREFGAHRPLQEDCQQVAECESRSTEQIVFLRDLS